MMTKKRIRRLKKFIDAQEQFRFKGVPLVFGAFAHCADITFDEFIDYRINHPTALTQDKIARLLRKREARDTGDCDIRVDPVTGNLWMHQELFICAACLCILELQDAVLWMPDGFKEGSNETDGWLLVEQRQIIGGAKFSLTDGHWEWQFVWIHPEHRRKGYLLKRLPQWIDRYGSFIADQPNQHVRALLQKAGYADKIVAACLER